MTKKEDSIIATGKVKWFNQFKGYGFVEVEDVSEDVFLHFSVINKSKIDHLSNNDVIMCEITESDKGYQVVNITELLHSNKHEIGNQEPKEVNAVMKWFNPSKGFGFAQLNSGEDVFVHSSLLKKHKLESIEPDKEIKLTVRYTNFGYEAIDIIL